VKGRTDSVSDSQSIKIEFNGDTTAANYHTQNNYADNGANSSSETASASWIGIVPAAGGVANSFSTGTISIDNYTDGNVKNAVGHFRSTRASVSALFVGDRMVTWNNTSAITSLTITPSTADNFDSGSEFILYGEKEVTVGSGGGGGTETILARKVLGTETLTSDSPSIDFSGLDQTYDRLIIQGYVRSDQAGTADNFLVEFNGDTTPSNYHRQSNYGVNGAAGVSEVSDAGLGVVSGNTAPAGSFGQITIVIENYAGSKRKVALSDFVLEAATDDLYAGQRGMIWENTAAITQVTLKPGSGTNLMADTKLTIIGEKELTVGGGASWTTVSKTANYTATTDDEVMCDTATTGAFTVTLPASPTNGDRVRVIDSASNWATANLTVGRNGNPIRGAAADVVFSTDDIGAEFIWNNNDSDWDYVEFGTGGGGGGTETIVAKKKLGSQTLTASQTTITFSAIDQTYDRLFVKVIGRTDQAAIASTLQMTFNNDTTLTNYLTQNLRGNDGTLDVREQSNLPLCGLLSGNTAPTDSFAAITIKIEGYASGNKKQALSDFIIDADTSNLALGKQGFKWNSTAAITEIDMDVLEGSNFVSGSKFELWGEKEITVGGGTDSNYVPYVMNGTAETATFTAVIGETHIIDTSGGSFTANLPAVATTSGRISFYFSGTGGQLTLDPNAAETIEGKSTIKIAQGHNTIENDGTEWRIIQRSGKNPTRLDPAQITADQNDYNPADWGQDVTYLYIDSDASRTITGIEENGFTDMAEVVIVNDGSNDIIIANDSASSTVNNRILVDGAADFTLGASQAGRLLRDGTANKWRLYAISAGGGGGGATTALDNLASTAVNADINPDTDETHDLGSPTLKYAEIHTTTANPDDNSSKAATTEYVDNAMSVLNGAGALTIENPIFEEILTDRDYEESTGSFRPIYTKTVDVGALPNNTTKNVAHNVASLSTWVDLYAIYSNGTFELPDNYYDPTNGVQTCINGANICVRTWSDRTSYSGHVTLFYTKTTDSTTAQPRNETLGASGSALGQSEVRLDTTNGFGSTATKVLRWTNATVEAGDDITYTDSATDGGTITINTTGYYVGSFFYSSGAASLYGLSINESDGTLDISAISAANRLGIVDGSWTKTYSYAATPFARWFEAGDVIRCVVDGAVAPHNAGRASFSIVHLGGAGGTGSAGQRIVAKKKLSSVNLASSQATLSFNDIDQTYDRLIIKWHLRTDKAVTLDSALIQANSDSTATNYHGQEAWGSDGSAVSGENANRFGPFVTGTTSPSDGWSDGVCVIENYSGLVGVMAYA
jgi:hypothetical protein